MKSWYPLWKQVSYLVVFEVDSLRLALPFFSSFILKEFSPLTAYHFWQGSHDNTWEAIRWLPNVNTWNWLPYFSWTCFSWYALVWGLTNPVHQSNPSESGRESPNKPHGLLQQNFPHAFHVLEDRGHPFPDQNLKLIIRSDRRLSWKSHLQNLQL